MQKILCRILLTKRVWHGLLQKDTLMDSTKNGNIGGRRPGTSLCLNPRCTNTEKVEIKHTTVSSTSSKRTENEAYYSLLLTDTLRFYQFLT